MKKQAFTSPRVNIFIPKTDLEVVWKYVQYAPSRASLVQTIKDSNKVVEVHKMQRERNLSLLSRKMLSRKKKDVTVSDGDAMSENDESKDQSFFWQDSKNTFKTKESSNKSSLNKRMSSVISKHDTPQVEISNLTLVFQQNKPQHFFGIRKPKTFETVTDKELKYDLIKNAPSIDEMFDYFVKPSIDLLRNSILSHSSQIRSLSSKYISLGLNEMTNRFTDANKLGKKKSVENDILEVLKEIAHESINEKARLLRLSDYRKIIFPDSGDKLARERIMHLFVNNHYREDHPRYKDRIKSNVVETDYENTIIKNCILNNKILLKVMKNPTFYPQKLRQKMVDIDLKLNSNYDDFNEKQSTLDTNLVAMPKLVEVKSSYRKRRNNVLDDIALDCKEFNGFYRQLLEYWIEYIIECSEYLGDIKQEYTKEVVQFLTTILANHRNKPGTKALFLTQQLLKCGISNHFLLMELCNNVEGWLDQILKSLLSKYPSIRLECFLTISYLVSKPCYINGINLNVFNETLYDLITTILRCIDLKSEEFPLYFSLLGIIFHYVHSQIILDCLIERGPYSSEVEMIIKWPKFVYLAIKHWPSDQFNTSPLYLGRIIETLENHYLREPLSRKNLKQAITCIVKRFKITSNMFTIYPKNNEYFPD